MMHGRIRIFAPVAALVLFTLAIPAFAEDPDPFLSPEEGVKPAPVNPPADTPAPTLGKDASKDAAKAALDEAAAPAPKDTSATSSASNPPVPEEQAPVPLSSIPGKTEKSAKPAAAAAHDSRDIYEQYDEYLDKQKEIQASEKDLSQRSLFPHENGSWQIGVIYVRNAFGGYNFDQAAPSGRIPSPPKLYADTQGANLLITWFPLKSLTFGRLGFGLTGGIYWSTFNVDTSSASGTATVNKASPQQVTSYGARAVYEFDYFLGQILVPFGFVGTDRVLIKAYSLSVGSQAIVDFAARQVQSAYYGGGVHFNLNRVEPVVASRALVNVGVKKFYLSYMALQRAGELSGLTHNLGLNFEF